MKDASFQLDSRQRKVIVGGRSTLLQEKTWQVLIMLVSRAQQIVLREDIIDVVWGGNFLTGDKGLNQALWSIRSALADDARNPRFIRTLPRVGYRWIGPIAADSRNKKSSLWRIVGKAAGVAVLVTMMSGVTYLGRRSPEAAVDAPVESPPVFATNAYLRNRDIVVDLSNGCRRVMVNANKAEIGTPVLSADGAHIAFTLQKESGCRMVTIDVSNGNRSDYGACPSQKLGSNQS